MKKKYTIILLTMFLLIISTAYAAVNNPKPIITVTTDEPSTIVSYSLTNASNSQINTDHISTSNDNKEFKFKPKENLFDGDYTFSITLKDEFGNTNQKTIDFTIELGPLSISLIEPEHGYTSTKNFDLKILTDRKAYCKFDNYDFSFKNMQVFSQTGNTEHIINNYVLDASYTYNINVKCNDSYKNEITSKSFVLHFDNTPPTITEKYAEPSTVVEYPPKTKLVVKTNEDSVCKYSLDKTNFEEMQHYFNEQNFNTTHEKENTLPDSAQATYTYHIKCKNKAALTSTKDDTITVNVDLAAELTIYVNTPQYLSTTTFDLDISTNKDAQCIYGNEPGNYQNTLPTTDNKRHKTTLTLSSGSYTYYVLCRSYPEEATKTITFTIDTTPPQMLYVREIGYGNESGKTYKTNSLKGSWKAEDNESGIALYNVLLYHDNAYSTDELIDSITTSDEEEEFTGLELNDSEKYYFKVSALNNVNLWSNNKTGTGIIVDATITPISCNNGIKDSNEEGVDCGGICSKGCPNGTSCNKNSDCESGFCNLDIDKCIIPTCNDRFKNGKESDIDCGGECDKKCDTGKNCGEDDDCESGNCDISLGKCVEAGKCYNKKLDPNEADVDCGGVCLLKCDNGKTCEDDYDCKSGNCADNRCFEPSCSDNMKNQDETDRDCGGSCTPCETGKSCLRNPDCISGNCENNICAELIADKDNDGLDNEWENRYNEGDLDVNLYDTDGNGVSDGDEDFDNDKLINIEEARYGTDPHKKDTDGDGYSDKEEINLGTNPLDPDDYPKSNILFYIFLFIALILLVVGAYFGYKKIKESKEGKVEIPPIEEVKPEKTLPEIKPITKTKPEEKPTFKKPGIPPIFKTRLEKKREEKRKKRRGIFEKFGLEPIVKKEKEIKKEPEPEEGPRIGWVELKAPKIEKPKEKIPSIFERLPKTPSRDVFSALSKMVGTGVTSTTVKEFTDVAEKTKLTKEELLKLINKFSKTKKVDEDTLHKILVSILEEKKTTIKKPKKERLPTIVKKETRKEKKKKKN